ncbi:MAG TPA: hypothetical protein VGH15_10435 [Caulobacteraceae bacterium]|jgi:hypothetical protein
MLRAIFTRLIDGMEKRWGYDASYMRMVNRASPWTMLKFSMVTAVVDRRDAPVEALAAAGIVGTLSEDCGPCTQISLDMAAAAGVPAAVLKAILAGDDAAMGEAATLAYRFARAVLAHDLAADDLRETVVRAWGEKGLVAIALAITTARMYPTLKYGLGFGKACARVIVAGAPAEFVRPLAA